MILPPNDEFEFFKLYISHFKESFKFVIIKVILSTSSLNVSFIVIN